MGFARILGHNVDFIAEGVSYMFTEREDFPGCVDVKRFLVNTLRPISSQAGSAIKSTKCFLTLHTQSPF